MVRLEHHRKDVVEQGRNGELVRRTTGEGERTIEAVHFLNFNNDQLMRYKNMSHFGSEANPSW